MFKSICVPLDGSTLAESSLPIALEIAQRDSAHIHLIEVVQPPWPDRRGQNTEAVTILTKAQCEQAKRYLDDATSAFKQKSLVTHVQVLEAFNIGDAILEYCAKHAIELVVMSTHGRGGIGRVLMGSVTDRVIQHATMPVLVNRPRQEKPHV